MNLFLQYCLPHHTLSRVIALLANSKRVWLKNFLIRKFIKLFQVNLDEALLTRVEDYPNFNAFFIRKLKKNTRPVDLNSHSVISPADGTLAAYGKIAKNTILQAKNIEYSIDDLFAHKPEAKRFHQGFYSIFYLSPRDYHRIHMPFSGRLLKSIYIPGRLFSVSPKVIEKIPTVFTRNERLVCLFETEQGMMTVIFIGAMLVAGIQTAWHGQVAPRKHQQIEIIDHTHASKPLFYQKGDELGYFEFGSSIILLSDHLDFQFDASLRFAQAIQMGQSLGQFPLPH